MVSFLFYRILRILNMQQIGRNYYNPDYAFNIPQHKYTRAALELFTLHKGHTRFTFYQIGCECVQSQVASKLLDNYINQPQTK